MGEDGVIGEIRLFAGSFAPKDWLFCQGQVLMIRQYTPLFSVIGTAYGGDGTTNFILPNFAGRAVIGAGAGPGLTARTAGETGGADTAVMTMNEMPAHTHAVTCELTPDAAATATTDSPTSNVPATAEGDALAFGTPPGSVMMASVNTVTADLKPFQRNAAAFGIQQPSLGLNYIICTNGIYPDRP